MRICDETAGIAAARHSGHRVVTAAMDRMTFLNAVYVGNLVSFYASVNAAWGSSMEVGIRVEAEDISTGVVTHTSTAYLTMVALDDNGRPAPVPPLEPEDEHQRRRQREAEVRRSNRLAERAQLMEERGGMRGGTLPGFRSVPRDTERG